MYLDQAIKRLEPKNKNKKKYLNIGLLSICEKYGKITIASSKRTRQENTHSGAILEWVQLFPLLWSTLTL